ncbi:receptor-like protein EIX1 [Humulus lupulus]|uniref:receptor-like protein EIX1 n=1 Tax=Humulus lupulus TaxID=3486 RepID=UPI002B403DAD|nr:receptor-like protein EIX1 [Humulus lupulus]
MKIVAVGLVLLLATAANVMSEINQPQCIEKEKEALLSFKLSLHDPGNLLSSWSNNGTNQNCCDWSFITCDDQTNHVIALNLTNYDHHANPVGGELGSSLAELQYLSYLNLYGMSFTRIPKSIGSLTELTYLGLGENPIHGIIPPQLGNLSKLQVLDLSSSSQMVVDNLEWLSHCTSLMTIFISNCLLPKVDTSSLSYTNNSFLFLKSLQLSENSIHPSTIAWLLNSTINLEKLVLTNNVIEGTFPNSFGHIKSLEYIDLSGNKLGIMGVPKSLSNLTNLKYLDLSHNNLKGTLHDLLENLFGSTKSSLENSFNSIFVLDFSHNLLSGSIPADYWGNFHFLIVLNLAHNMLSGEIPSSISMPILQTLQLSHNNLSGTLPSSLKTCGFLRILDLGSNNLTGPIPPWIGEIPKILVLLSLKSNNFYGSIPLNIYNISTSKF